MDAPRAYLRENPACLRLYAVTDDAWLGGRTLEACCAAAVRGGVTFLQLRDKHATSARLEARYRAIEDALACMPAASRVPFVINDDVQAALVCDADGVHVGQSDTACAQARALLGPDKIVGVSAQTVEQALAAEAAGADYLGVGALIATATKPDAAIVARDELARICAAVSIPVVGIGGLGPATLSCLQDTGVQGAAVVSAVFAADDIEAASAALKEGVERVV
ncbi:MAG: thiamine phosphate synthase [Slackia faecicanis]|nr:thiamine phosphate synthase [Slackia faecicanis]